MPKYLDRATRTLVWQYGNETATVAPPGVNTVVERKEAAPKAFDALEKLLDTCAEAEANCQRGRSPMVTVHYIRKQITEALS